MKKQAETISLEWLYNRGYTVASAARKLRRSTPHVCRVLKGQRESKSLTLALLSLPKRKLILRERVGK